MHRALEFGRHDVIDGSVEGPILNHVRFLICIGTQTSFDPTCPIISCFHFVRSISVAMIEEWISTSYESGILNMQLYATKTWILPW